MVPQFYCNLYCKELEVTTLAYTSFISDVHKSYRVEKIVLHRLISLLIRLVSVHWFQTQFYHKAKGCGIKLCLKPITTYFFHMIRPVVIGNEAFIRRHINF